MGSLVLNGATSGSTTLTPTDGVTATLTLPSSTGTILTTANPQSGGVIQVVEGSISTGETFTNSTSYVSTNLSATITPKFSTSKVLVIVSSTLYAANSTNACAGTIYRSGTDIASSATYGLLFWGEGVVAWGKCCSTILDSPATTSSTTYQLYIKTTNASYQGAANRNNTRNSIILMEIAA